MVHNNTYIRFDWAMKHMLRDKSNFGILEGLISVLLGEEVKIVELLESESNQDSDSDKFNRVDIKAEGHAEGLAKVAANMIALGMDSEMICTATGLTPQQVEDIRHSSKSSTNN